VAGNNRQQRGVGGGGDLGGEIDTTGGGPSKSTNSETEGCKHPVGLPSTPKGGKVSLGFEGKKAGGGGAEGEVQGRAWN